jgi:cell division protein FtsW
LLLMGFGLMFFVHKIPFKVFSKLSKFGFYLAIVLLVLTMLVGQNVNGADRWLKIPLVPFSFQTSDFAKIALVLYLAKQLIKRKNEFNDFKVVSRYIILPIALIMFLILPSNLSTAMLVGLIAFVLLILGNFPWKWIGVSIGAAILAFVLLLQVAKVFPDVLPRMETWRMRIVRMADDNPDPQEQMQINNSLTAIKNGGGLLPKGPGNGELKHYIPEAYADFYFAALTEEFGMYGVLIIIGLYLMLFFRIIKVGLKSKDEYATLVAIGIGASIMFPAIINMMVSTKLMPVTGQNMPLLSMGGTSAWFTCIAFGVVLSISRENNRDQMDGNEEDLDSTI